ncbi:hypothetical protein FQ087_12850 [Sporosarcina sp. ANT_H38]|uniref:hypothetical protein n=1 Tax=Sporosarcina sp. ANT_H38 TaxID=2597358 RepID=UPI0011F3145F|nr:hypothetical protein [Sporosarcina sp. ANT_H38]KAA0955495.1 hypothetical protein FQ087_12850 [Sporosarcina sp. ANT_H38]
MRGFGNLFGFFGFVIVLMALFNGGELLHYLGGMTIMLFGLLNITDANVNELKMEIKQLETKISRLESESS